MLDFYFHPTPNGTKVALLLEELQLPYALKLIDILKGEQHDASYQKINPNGKVPAIVDDGITIFDSHAILLHLAEKHGRFMPSEASERAAALSWLQLVATGLSPFSGQAVHFLHYSPEPVPYARNRYLKEVERHYRVLDKRLSETPYLAGRSYSIADIALWGWANSADYIFGERGVSDYSNVKRLVDEISAREAVERVNALKSKLKLKSEMDEEARLAMFPQNQSV
ncbi:glutathione S-transferase family protein [Burkholderia sp. L27(2015)]|uniref:glutathione S-transferase family protein n=1 Tax=Burkholderia sp. L27(2015) TaxID=1641858 RepID=UPI00131A9C77|nr:glutathione S-transferase N-terminal domain-containing protein [Burkholderia sp. L27(2015)]